MSRIFAVFLLLVVLAVGGSAIAATAYQAGLTTAVAQVPADAGTVVQPVVVHGYGWGWGFPGFGIFGFFATLFFIFLVFGLLRAIFWGGRGHRGWGGPGWGPGGPGGPGYKGWDQDGSPWRDRAHGTFETWHREAHASGEGHGAPGDSAPGPGAFGGPAAPPSTPA
jgi:hypothetical protein